jgi:hypothetical protein
MATRRRRRPSGNSTFLPAIIIGVVLIILIGGGCGLTWFVLKMREKGGANSGPFSFGSSSELSAAIAETDKKDRQWRLADIAVARMKLDPDKNGALLALSAARQFPQETLNALDGVDSRRDPSQPIPDFDVQRLRNALRSCGPAISEARKIAFKPQGQFEIDFNFERPLDTKLERQQLSRKAAALLVHDSQLLSVDRDGNGAMQSAYAAFILAHYHDDEPFLICQLVQVAIQMAAIGALERAMTCANIPDEILKATQELLESEAEANRTVMSFRGERASRHEMIELKQSPGDKISDSEHAWFLRIMNRGIELAKKGPPYYSSEWSSFLKDLGDGSPNVLRITPALDKIRDVLARRAANLRTASLAIAAERYRRDKGEWPSELRLLVPYYIKSVPSDPFAGGPILHAQVAQGFTVYVQGLAAVASGNFSAIGTMPDHCQGFRLLNPGLRR